MELVDYPDSDMEVSGAEAPPNLSNRPRGPQLEQKQSPSSRKRKHGAFAKISHIDKPTPPSLPSAFHSLYATNVRRSTLDDPSLHGGRKRRVPHIEGNWPTHVYLEWYPARAELATLERVLRAVQAQAGAETTSTSSVTHSLLQSNLGVQLPLHISLSAPLMLRTEERGAFLEKLANAVESSGVRPFQVVVVGLDWVPNENNTRWFLVLRLERPENDGLNHLLAMTNCVARTSGLEMLYTDGEPYDERVPDQLPPLVQLPAGRRELSDKEYKEIPAEVPTDCTSKFHLSIAWQLGEPDKGRLVSIGAIQSVKHIKISCESLKVKIGNAIHDISLPECRFSLTDPDRI